MGFGYTGRILHINLTSGDILTDQPSELFYRKYFGGRAFIAYYLLHEMKEGVDPLSGESVLVFASSAIGGAPTHGLCRFSVGAKSPLTGGFGESEAGGYWGPELKMAGYDALVIKGKADSPVYLWIHDCEVQIRAASHIWGLTTGEAQEAIRKELGDQRIRIAIIGPGGENLIPYANIANELSHLSGRTGMGAVMGSKNLKAIACRGKQKIEYADQEIVKKVAQRVANDRKDNPMSYGLHHLGTPAAIMHFNHLGTLPTKNFREGTFPGAEKISGERMADSILADRGGCYACAIRCKRVVGFESDRFNVDPHYGGPEYEALASFGSNCGIDDLETIAKANELCNKYGIDVISTGNSISFAMDCYEQGLLPKDWAGDIDLRFGNADILLQLIEDIVHRRGLGKYLANGVRAMAAELGSEAEKLSVHSKGQEIALHDGRGKAGVALGYALVEKGGDHLVSGFDILYERSDHPGLISVAPLGIHEPLDVLDMGPKKIRLCVYMSYLWSFYNCASICNFAFVPRSITTLSELVDLVKGITGWETSLWELMKIGERAINLARVFNSREGFTRADDSLPDRFFEPLVGEGPLAGYSLDRKVFEEALDFYYAMMGWNQVKGCPTYAKLIELDVDWAAEHLP